MKKIVFLLLLQTASSPMFAQSLLDAELEFSKLSSEIGFFNAVKHVADDSLVLLRPNNVPIVGKNLAAYLAKEWPKNTSLTWKPEKAFVAQSGELGYTYGIYTLTIDMPDGKQTIEKGTYTSIWKKDAKSMWRLVLDTGNEGIKNKE